MASASSYDGVSRSTLMPNPASLSLLVAQRSAFVMEILQYLDRIADDDTLLPAHDQNSPRGADAVARNVMPRRLRVVADRRAPDEWHAAELERIRATGAFGALDAAAYATGRAGPYDDQPVPSTSAPLEWDDIRTQYRYVVVLGDPGFGKSTLARAEVRRVAAEQARCLRSHAISPDQVVLPFFAALPDIRHTLGQLGLVRALKRIVLPTTSGTFWAFARRKLTSSECYIVLDGLDEIFSQRQQEQCRRQLERFVRRRPEVRILITSRTVGYLGSPISGAEELELIALHRDDVISFVTWWFGDRHREASALCSHLERHTQLRELARVPLLLSLICGSYDDTHRRKPEDDVELPTRRVDLYEHCLARLIEGREERLGLAISDDTFELLPKVAYRMHEGRSVHFGARDLKRLAGFDEQNQARWDAGTRFVEELKDVGIVVRHSRRRHAPFQWLHRSFGDYLTACELARLPNAVEIAAAHANDPAWEQVIVLLAGMLSDPLSLLATLVDEKSDDYFRHRLALAALCLPEIAPTGASSSLRGMAENIVRRTLRLWEQHSRDFTAESVPHLTRALSSAVWGDRLFAKSGVADRWSETQLHYQLEQLNAESSERRDAAVRVLRALDAGTVGLEVVSRLAHAVTASSHVEQASAATALGALGTGAALPSVIESLVGRLTNAPVHGRIHVERALEAISVLSPASKDGASVMDGLFDNLAFQEWKVLRAVAETLGALGTGSIRARIVGELGEWLCTSMLDGPDLGDAVLERVFKVRAPQPRDVNQRLVALAHEDHRAAQQGVMWALGELGPGVSDPAVVNALSALLLAPDSTTRVVAAWTLGQLRPAVVDTSVVTVLQGLLEDSNWRVRRAVVTTLGALTSDHDRPDILRTLRLALEDDNYQVRLVVARTLGSHTQRAVRSERDELLSDILARLTDERSHTREAAAATLEAIGAKGAQSVAIQSLFAALNDSDFGVRVHATRALARIGARAARPEILASLLTQMTDSHFSVRSSTAWALSVLSLPETHSKVIAVLLNHVVGDDDWHVRRSSAWALGDMGVLAIQPRVAGTLLAACTDEHLSVRFAASEALAAIQRHCIVPSPNAGGDLKIQLAILRARGMMMLRARGRQGT